MAVISDRGASILAKLKNKAKASGMPYQQCLQLFFQEEFLRRLSKSQYKNNLILKGGLFIYVMTDFDSRATVDIDMLLRHMSSELKDIDTVIREILDTPTGNNGVVILSAKKMEPISLQRKYPGISTQIVGRINNVRVPFDLDIGVGDVIVPKPQKRFIQTQLEGYDSPEILTYTLESTIAEKTDAILQRLELTGRMKDFFDIYYLSRTFDFDGGTLKQAIEKTLRHRGTPYDISRFNRIGALDQDADMQVKWRYFQRNVRDTGPIFIEVLQGIDAFLRPVFESMGQNDEFCATWSASDMKWIIRQNKMGVDEIGST